MKAVILAAGAGTRMGGNVDMPKCLLPFGKQTILGATITSLAHAGVNDVIIACGYQAEKIDAYLAASVFPSKINCVYIPTWSLANNLWSLYFMQPYLLDSYLIVNGDTWLDNVGVIRVVATKGTAAAIKLKSSCVMDDMKVVILDGVVRQISKLVGVADGVAVGVYKIVSDDVEKFKGLLNMAVRDPTSKDKFYLSVLELIPHIKAVDVTDCAHIEIDTPDDYKRALQEGVLGS